MENDLTVVHRKGFGKSAASTVCSSSGRYIRRFLGPPAVVLALLSGVCAPSHAEPRSVSIDVPPGDELVLQARGVGDQIYGCMASGAGAKWMLERPDARLMDSSGHAIGSHFAGPTWKLNDGSTVQGELVASRPSSDDDSVAWLLLRAKPNTATGRLAKVALIQRTDTHGGAAPSSGCESVQNAGKTVHVPYTASYSFYAQKLESSIPQAHHASR